MSSFYQLVGRLQNKQQIKSAEAKAMLGIDVTQESQDIEGARRDYSVSVENAEREMARRARKRSKKAMFATLGTMIGSAVLGIGPVGSALIAGAASGLARKSVAPYSATISSTLPGGKFHSEARQDLGADINSTNAFITDAAEGQSLLNWSNALSDSATAYQFGKEVPSIKEGFREWAIGKPTGGTFLDADAHVEPLSSINKVDFPDNVTWEGGVGERFGRKGRLFQGKLGERMRKTQLAGYKDKLLNEQLKRQLLGLPGLEGEGE